MFVVTKKIDSENIKKLCRTCLREDGEKMVCLFVGPAGSSLAAKLRSLSCLEVWQGDGLPERLCDRCVTRAESALLFREQCRAADRALRQAASKTHHSELDCTTTTATAIESTTTTKIKPVSPTNGFVQDSLSCNSMQLSMKHMDIVESTTTTSDSYFSTNVNQQVSPTSTRTIIMMKNERPACALHCSFCNHTFSNRNQLINHKLSHCNLNDINQDEDEEYDDDVDDTSEIAENLSFNRSISSVDLTNTAMNYGDLKIPDNCLSEESTSESLLRQQDQSDKIIQVSYSQYNCNNISTTPLSKYNNKKDDDDDKKMKKKNKHSCDICGKSYDKKSKLITHSYSHSGERPFKCLNCDKAYTCKSKLTAHTRLFHTKINIYQCKLCNKTFSYPSYLKEHGKIHINKKIKTKCKNSDVNNELLFQCSICEKKYKLKKNLISHIKLHSGNSLFNCEICDKSFTQKYNLKVHMKIHCGIKHYECEYCCKKFMEKGNYNEHLRIHTKIKPFSCSICGKAFSQSSHLKSHKVTHNNFRAHQCKVCGKTFKLLSHLKRHTESLHTRLSGNNKLFKCLQCNEMFSQAFSLKRHHKKKHAEQQQQ